jgi:hypothetical protein
MLRMPVDFVNAGESRVFLLLVLTSASAEVQRKDTVIVVHTLLRSHFDAFGNMKETSRSNTTPPIGAKVVLSTRFRANIFIFCIFVFSRCALTSLQFFSDYST